MFCNACFTESESLSLNVDDDDNDDSDTVANDVDNGHRHISSCLNSSLCNCSDDDQPAQLRHEKLLNCSEGKSAFNYRPCLALLFDVVFCCKGFVTDSFGFQLIHLYLEFNNMHTSRSAQCIPKVAKVNS